MPQVVISRIKLNKLEGEFGPGGLQIYTLAEDHRDDIHDEFLVPKGFRTNGASIPKMLRWAVDPVGKMFRAAVVHDYLYTAKKLSRRHSDKIFKRILVEDGVPRWLAYSAYVGLRAGGSAAWHADPHPKQIKVWE